MIRLTESHRHFFILVNARAIRVGPCHGLLVIISNLLVLGVIRQSLGSNLADRDFMHVQSITHRCLVEIHLGDINPRVSLATPTHIKILLLIHHHVTCLENPLKHACLIKLLRFLIG